MYLLHPAIPEVIIPLRARDGSTLFCYENRSVALFPSISGTQFDRESPLLRHQAATLLARLHLSLLRNTPDTYPLERHLLTGAPPLSTHSDSQALVDRELDRWNETLLQRSASFVKGLIHGDYYRRNLLTQGERIIALLDWDNLHFIAFCHLPLTAILLSVDTISAYLTSRRAFCSSGVRTIEF